jgi:hypothetical protein
VRESSAFPIFAEDLNMSSLLPPTESFTERRNPSTAGSPPARERRQFVGSYDELSAEGGEIARAVDDYKLQHRRRFVTYDEILSVIKSLGYSR